MDPLKQWVSDAAAAQFAEEQLQSLVAVQRSQSQRLTIETDTPYVEEGRFQGDDWEDAVATSPSLTAIKSPTTAYETVEECFRRLDDISRALDRHITSQAVAKPSNAKESSSAWRSSSRKVAPSDIALRPMVEASPDFVRAMSSKKLHALSRDVAQLVDTHSEHIQQVQKLEADIVAAQRQKEEDLQKEDLANKRRKRMAFTRNINLCTEVLGVYFGKTCRTPITSIERDESLLFDLVEPSRAGRFDPKTMHTRVLQIKVRVNAIVNSIVSNELPDEVYVFMCSLLSDGNALPDTFLYEFERERLLFDDNNETVDMIPILNDCDLKEPLPPQEEKSMLQEVFSRIGGFLLSIVPWASKSSPVGAAEADQPFSRPSDIISIGNGQSADVRKVRMLLQNFVVIKVLINVVLLSPWSIGAAALPKKTKRDWQSILRMIGNYRMVASIMYKLLRLLDPSLPPIAHQAQPGSPTVQRGASATKATAPVPSPSLKKSSLYDHSSPSKKGGKGGASQHAPESPERNEERKAAKFWVEECLIGKRRLFQPLSATMSLLLPEDPYYIHAQPQLDEWLGATAKKLSTWMTGLVSRMVRQKLRGVQPSLMLQRSLEPSPAVSREVSRPGTRDALVREEGQVEGQEEGKVSSLSERALSPQMAVEEEEHASRPEASPPEASPPEASPPEASPPEELFDDATLDSLLAELGGQ